MAESKSTFETDLKRLEELVAQLEQGELPLEEAIKVFQEGMTLTKRCAERLSSVEKEIKKLVAENDKFKLETFESPDA